MGAEHREQGMGQPQRLGCEWRCCSRALGAGSIFCREKQARSRTWYKSLVFLYDSIAPEVPPSVASQRTGVTHPGAAVCSSPFSHPRKSSDVALHRITVCQGCVHIEAEAQHEFVFPGLGGSKDINAGMGCRYGSSPEHAALGTGVLPPQP